jgi:hypothetical protein
MTNKEIYHHPVKTPKTPLFPSYPKAQEENLKE